ncbi:MAG TPA: YciI family protein [Thermoanaerobaculia bacterium]|nr:YciI family protein [Thermoanaerobaculia bacterium]
MKYILLIYGDEKEWESLSPEEMQKVYAEHGAYAQAMEKAGVMRGGYELKPVSTATTLRFTGGKPTTFDGPFAETKEQLGGYYLIEVDNLEQALEWAAKMPAMHSGSVEVRPLGMGG